MLLPELLTEVYSLTNRPDLVSDTTSTIRTALLKMHHTDFYYKDLTAAFVTPAQVDYVTSFDTSVLPRYRAMKFIREWNSTANNLALWPASVSTSGKAGPFLDCMDPAEVLDAYGRDRTNVYYISGTAVNMRTRDVPTKFLVSWYQNPDISIIGMTNTEDWIMSQHPYAVVMDAAAAVFKMIGYDEQSTRYSNLVMEQIALLKQSNIEGEAR